MFINIFLVIFVIFYFEKMKVVFILENMDGFIFIENNFNL